MSPTWRTLSLAKAGRGALFIGRPSENGIGCTTVSSPWPARFQSSAVSVSSTPGMARGDFCRDPADARVAMGAAHERAPRRPGRRYVIDKQPLAAQEAHVLAPAQRLADVADFAAGRLNVHAGASR